jgi:hypothetical protein
MTQGNRENYQNPRNSLLPDVLSLRTGIPLSLSVVHMAVGRRAGLPIQLINMPMHVISCLRPGGADSDDGGDEEETLYIDVYNKGRILSGMTELQ